MGLCADLHERPRHIRYERPDLLHFERDWGCPEARVSAACGYQRDGAGRGCPALVAQYETQMIPKAVLQQKLHEWDLMLQAPEEGEP